jgi:glycine oxidase
MENSHVVLAGGGIIGLSTALHLAISGVRTTLLERGQTMSEASWAAAGMLAAHDPDNPPALRSISELSLKLYPHFLDALERLSGQQIRLRTHLTLQGSARGSSFSTEDRKLGRPVSSYEAGELAPGLVTSEHEFILLEENSLDPRDLCSALPKAAAAAGVSIHEQAEVTGIETGTDGVRIYSTKGAFSGSEFVNCCGAWAGELLNGIASHPSAPLGIEPRKGQIVTVAKDAPLRLSVVIRTPEMYLVPRGDGRVVVGATMERSGFNKEVDSAITRTLVQEAQALFPPLHGAIITESWAGLRPGSADGLPVMAQWSPRHWIATGHFRNGILLAPATGHLMSKMIRGIDCEIPPNTFSLERFSAASI